VLLYLSLSSFLFFSSFFFGRFRAVASPLSTFRYDIHLLLIFQLLRVTVLCGGRRECYLKGCLYPGACYVCYVRYVQFMANVFINCKNKCVCVCVFFVRIPGTRKYDWLRRPGCHGWQFPNKIDEVVSTSVLILMRVHEQVIWVFVFTVLTVGELHAPGSKKCRWLGGGGCRQC